MAKAATKAKDATAAKASMAATAWRTGTAATAATVTTVPAVGWSDGYSNSFSDGGQRWPATAAINLFKFTLINPLIC